MLQLQGGGVNADFWRTFPDGRVVRVHNVPRKALYVPDACPVPLDQLQDERVTEAIYEAEMRDHVLTDTITDNWRQDLGRELVAKWVGETIFRTTPTTTLASSSARPASGQFVSQPAMPAIPEERPTVFMIRLQMQSKR